MEYYCDITLVPLFYKEQQNYGEKLFLAKVYNIFISYKTFIAELFVFMYIHNKTELITYIINKDKF